MRKELIVLLFGVLFLSGVIFAQDTKCRACWDVANVVLESWIELFLYGGTFTSCAEFCSRANWGEACIAVCTVLGDEAFFHLLNDTDLDPIYVCQLLDACPIDDCGPVCGNFNNVTANPDSIDLPPEDHDFVTFNVTYTLTKPWKGTGVIYYQMVQCDSGGCTFLANNFWLLEPNGAVGTFTAQFAFNYDCPVQFDIGRPLTAQFYICNGNCDEYGVARHPHSALYDQTSYQIGTGGDCPDAITK